MVPGRTDLRLAAKVRASAAFFIVGAMAGTGLYFVNLAYVGPKPPPTQPHSVVPPVSGVPPAPQTVCGQIEPRPGPFLCMVGFSQGVANAAFAVRGSGFDPGTTVMVILTGLDPENIPILDITARVRPMVGQAGTFSFAISAVYPGVLQLGLYTVDVRGAGGDRASTEFFVIPPGVP